MNKKEILREYAGFLSKYDFEGTIEEVSKKIIDIPKRLQDNYPTNSDIPKYHRYSIRHDHDYDYGESSDVYILQTYRWETDEEFNDRLKKDSKRNESAKKAAITKKETKEKREKTLYENLKKKFEK